MAIARTMAVSLSGKQISCLFDAENPLNCAECNITKDGWEDVLKNKPYQKFMIHTVNQTRYFKPYICSWECFVCLRVAKRIDPSGYVISKLVCQACIDDQPNQLAHYGNGGCLGEEPPF